MGRERETALQADVLEISLVNDLREIAGVAARIDDFCSAHGLSPQVGYGVNLAIDEILTNTISYGYDDEEPHRIELIVRLEEEALAVIIVDDSKAFDLSQAPEPGPETSLEVRLLDGLGLFLVHQVMDDVAYQRIDGCNVVTLTKKTTENDDQSLL